MKSDEIKKAINNLQKELEEKKADLQELIIKLNETMTAKEYYKPKVGESFYTVNHEGEVTKENALSATDRYRVFKLKSKASKYAEYIKAEAKLEEAISIANGGWTPDQTKRIVNHYIVYSPYDRVKLAVCSTSFKMLPNSMHCKSRKVAEQIIKGYPVELTTYLTY